MDVLKSDGNGGYNISKASTVTLGLALIIIGMVGGMAVAWGTQAQLVEDHCENSSIHWTSNALETKFMPRGELEVHLSRIDASLIRMERKLDRISP